MWSQLVLLLYLVFFVSSLQLSAKTPVTVGTLGANDVVCSEGKIFKGQRSPIIVRVTPANAPAVARQEEFVDTIVSVSI